MYNLIKFIIEKIQKHNNPIRYWKKKGLSIGAECEINASASFGSEPYLVKLGNHVRVNSGVNFITHDGGVWVLRWENRCYNDVDLFGRILVGDNVHIGTNSTIMPGTKIGNNVIIGCGAVVTRDVPDNSVAAGIPARVIESLEDYKEKHRNEFFHTKNMSRGDKKTYILKNLK